MCNYRVSFVYYVSLTRVRNRKNISFFSTKTYVVGTQKNRLKEMVLLSIHNICLNLWARKYLQFYAENIVYLDP